MLIDAPFDADAIPIDPRIIDTIPIDPSILDPTLSDMQTEPNLGGEIGGFEMASTRASLVSIGAGGVSMGAVGDGYGGFGAGATVAAISPTPLHFDFAPKKSPPIAPSIIAPAIVATAQPTRS